MKRLILAALFTFCLSGSVSAADQTKLIYPATPVIYNKTLTSANTEYSQALPGGCKKIMVQCRTAYDVKITYTALASGTTYYTLKSGTWYWDDFVDGTAKTLYMQSAQAGVVVEVMVWY
jgi:hypothetical protein